MPGPTYSELLNVGALLQLQRPLSRDRKSVV